MKTIPSDVEAYQRTAEFTESTVPKGLLKSHTTKAGVWGRICVIEGALRYRIHGDEPEELVLEPGKDGVVEPQCPHDVLPIDRVRFFVEFSKRPTSPSGDSRD